MRRGGAVVLVMVMGVVTAGCSGSGSGDSEDSANGSGGDAPVLRATLQSSTLFATHHALSLSIRPEGDHDVQIGTIQLSSPLFESVAPEERETVVRSGRTMGMPLAFGAADCNGEADGPAELIADIDGEKVHVVIEESPSDLLATMHGAECAEAAILEDVDLRLSDGWERTDPTTAEGALEVIQQRAGVTAAIDDMEGNVIFALSVDRDDGEDPWLEVNDDEPTATGKIVIEAARCDPHALIEFKRPFFLSAWVRLGDADPVRVDIEAQGTARQALADLMAGCLQ